MIYPLLTVLALVSACSANITSGTTIQATPEFVTATLPPTNAASATATFIPPTLLSLPTSPPLDGTTTTQLNVRSEPSTAGNSLGVVTAFSKVQVLGREENGAWFQIVYAESPDGKGWITAAYVQINAAEEVPVVEITSGSGSVVSGLVIQGLNVRSGPGTNFESFGTLIPNDVVLITGKDSSGKWIQVQYKGQVGWASSEFLRINAGTESLPVTLDTVPTTTAATQNTTSTIFSAPQDGDSIQSPSISVIFSSDGTDQFQFNGIVSTPDGDTEDWIQFTADGATLFMEVICSGNGTSLEIWNNEQSMENQLVCNGTFLLPTQAGETYSLRIQATASETQQVSPYLLSIKRIR